MKPFRLLHRLVNKPALARAAAASLLWAWVWMLSESPATAATAMPGLRQSKHNLALTSRARAPLPEESDMCKFCHTPHGGTGDRALWNQMMSGSSYIPYSSSTMKATVGQPTGASRLCLSCHDGTVAPGTLHRQRRTNPARAPIARMNRSRSVLGTDLSDDHPVSMTYDPSLAAGAQLKDPATLVNKVRLDERQQVQCTSCHDPHNEQYGMFLVQNNTGSALCLNCHDPKLWRGSSHQTSGRTWNGTGQKPWPHTSLTTVAENGCENCHAPHHAGTRQRLLNYEEPEDNCLVCHNGAVALKDVASEINKPSAHPVLTTSTLHDAAEDPVNPRKRHAACADCHNPHAANATPASRPNASGALAGVAGVGVNGTPVKSVLREHELCFRCHAEGSGRRSNGMLRQWAQPNIRLQFTPSNASFHPVAATGKNSRVPSLLMPWNTASYIYCTDCHNNNQGPAAGGSGPNGPHGSLFFPILEQNLILQDFQEESPAAYALCYKCHIRSSILSDASFKYHRKHVVTQRTACTTCHDSHGVAQNQHLINFNTTYVKPQRATSQVRYTPAASPENACILNCHGVEHPVKKP